MDVGGGRLPAVPASSRSIEKVVPYRGCACLRVSALSVWGLGFGVWGVGFGLGFGFRVSGLRFRVQGLRFRVQGLGFRVEGLGFRVPKARGGGGTRELAQKASCHPSLSVMHQRARQSIMPVMYQRARHHACDASKGKTPSCHVSKGKRHHPPGTTPKTSNDDTTR